jgi:hypothetical protein
MRLPETDAGAPSIFIDELNAGPAAFSIGANRNLPKRRPLALSLSANWKRARTNHVERRLMSSGAPSSGSAHARESTRRQVYIKRFNA